MTEKPADESDSPPPVLLSINGELMPVSSIRMSHKLGGEVIAHRETGAIPQSSNSAVQSDGSVISVQRGAPAQGESQSEATCRALAAAWRTRGRTWYHIQLAEPHDDCDCIARHGRADEVRIQVVRADSSPDAWRTLAKEGEYSTMSGTAEPRAAILRYTIQKKAERTPRTQRERLVLALDATTSSAFALGAVIRSFREQHGDWAASQGFNEIWLVGPTAEMTYRLDAQEETDTA